MNLEIPGDYRRPFNREYLVDLINETARLFHRVKFPESPGVLHIERIILPRLLDARDKFPQWHVVDACVFEVEALVREVRRFPLSSEFCWQETFNDFYCTALALLQLLNDLQWRLLHDDVL